MEIDTEKTGFAKWWLWVLGLIIISIIALGLLRAGGLIFTTAVEREVFEQSYQRSAAQQAKYNTLSAELVGLETRLRAGGLNDTQRADMEAQAAALRVQIDAME